MSSKKKAFSSLAAITVGVIAGSAVALSPVIAFADHTHGEKGCGGAKAAAGEKSCGAHADASKTPGHDHEKKGCGGAKAAGEKGCGGAKAAGEKSCGGEKAAGEKGCGGAKH